MSRAGGLIAVTIAFLFSTRNEAGPAVFREFPRKVIDTLRANDMS